MADDKSTDDKSTDDKSAEGKRTAPGQVPAKAVPLQPGDPEVAPSSLGSTFAERKKAREASEKRITRARAEDKAVRNAEGE